MPRILPCADSALLISFAGEAEPGSRVLGLDRALAADPAAGIGDLIPGLDSLLVVLDGSAPPAAVRARVETALAGLERSGASHLPAGRDHRLPVRFGGADGPDLDRVADQAALSPGALIALLTTIELRVALVGHLPGLPYLRGLPASLDLPRRPRPRTAVPAGSVGIAAAMACVYPARAPGGWHLVGRTDARMVDLERQPPFLLAPGDRVRMIAVR